MDVACPVCRFGTSSFHARIDGFDYFRCGKCESLHIDPAVLKDIDAGHDTCVYDKAYWARELKAARARAKGPSLVRVGEAILYARRPVRRFLDVGTGPGFLLDELALHFQAHADAFHGVALFPPKRHSRHPNYLIGSAGDQAGTFDAGVCIEVVEHLTPAMLAQLAGELASISAPGTLWLFNTGMPDLVLHQDPGYLDPRKRGHIVAYGVRGLEKIFGPHGFRVTAIAGKNHAWIAEYQVEGNVPSFDERIHHPLPQNRALLESAGVVYQAAFESARASMYMDLAMQRSRWALASVSELDDARQRYADLDLERSTALEWARTLDVDRTKALEWARALDAPLAQTRGKLDALQGELTQLKADHARIIHSRTWRWTRFVRAIVGWFRSREKEHGRED